MLTQGHTAPGLTLCPLGPAWDPGSCGVLPVGLGGSRRPCVTKCHSHQAAPASTIRCQRRQWRTRCPQGLTEGAPTHVCRVFDVCRFTTPVSVLRGRAGRRCLAMLLHPSVPWLLHPVSRHALLGIAPPPPALPRGVTPLHGLTALLLLYITNSG